MARGCPRLRFERRFVSGGGVEGFGIFAYEGKREVGHIFTRRYQDGAPFVSWVNVDHSVCRTGIATKLYEQAATAVCEKYGSPLRSDVERSAPTQSFWEKQVTKGRAECAGSTTPTRTTARPGETIVGRGGCLYYQLKSCSIRDLSGRKSLPGRRK